ncbi:hypothetical protein ACFQMM_04330 [Saliphagus sp. GCM10025308]
MDEDGDLENDRSDVDDAGNDDDAGDENDDGDTGDSADETPDETDDAIELGGEVASDDDLDDAEQ